VLWVVASRLAVVLAAAPPVAHDDFDPAAFDRGAAADLNADEVDDGPAFRLEPRRDGAYVYRDLETGFRAVIHADGSVDYPTPAADMSLKILGFELLKRRPKRESPSSTPKLPPGPSPPRGFGDPTHDPGSYGAAPILVTLGGRMPGLTDLVQRKRKKQRNAVKRKFLLRTGTLREQLRARTELQNARDQLGALRAELQRVWFDTTIPVELRKRRLFELWDDCRELPPDAVFLTPAERIQLKGALTTRRLIEGFVRQHAVTGTKAGYTPVELRQLNAMRTSRQRFDPYEDVQPRVRAVNLLRMRPR
jgi:hypothetical protein